MNYKINNELSNKASSTAGVFCDVDCDLTDEGGYRTPPTRTSPTRTSPAPHRAPFSRRPFHPNNFHHPGDQRRFPHPHFDPRCPPFERGPSLERCPPPPHHKFFGGRPFHFDHRHPFPPGGPPHRRPFKFLGGRGGFYVRGASPPYGVDGCPRRRWSAEDEAALAAERGVGGVEETPEGGGYRAEEEEDRPSQPVHTVLIDNEEYTKIQTPRQEVIFKKSSLDKKRDTLDLESSNSTCGSVTGGDPSSQGDQGSVAGSVEEATTPSSSEELPHQENREENRPYEDTSSIFVGEPGKPPLAGVVMQQAYPGGPMISIPVHWTPFLDPGLIPGDTALTTLDPAFTHVIDPKDLTVDPAHILPIQHDANGCPVTVQVKIDADGHAIEIEPSAFTVSLSTLEPNQQEVLLHRSGDLFFTTQSSSPHVPLARGGDEKAVVAGGEEKRGERKADGREMEEEEDVCKEKEDSPKNGAEHSEDCSSDSQYATMSEASTAPTTPSGELSDPSDTSESTKSRLNKPSAEISSSSEEDTVPHSDSLLDSVCLKTEAGTETFVHVQNSCLLTDESSSTKTVEDNSSSLTSSLVNHQLESSSSDSPNQGPNLASSQESLNSCTKGESNKKKNRKNKKARTLSIDSNVSLKNSCLPQVTTDCSDEAVETVSKYQAKRAAKKNKKDKKRLSKETKTKETKSKSVSEEEDSPMQTDSQDSGSSKEESLTFVKIDNISLVKEFDTCLPKDIHTTSSLQNGSESVSEKDENSIAKVNAPTCVAEPNQSEIPEINTEDELSIKTTNNSIVATEEVETPKTTENQILQEKISEVKTQETASSEDVGATNSSLNTTEKSEESAEQAAESDTPSPTETKPLEGGETVPTSLEEGSNTPPTKDEASPESPQSKPGGDHADKEGKENYVCKPGFVMVPILTPYYDPAVLYGYPLVIPETPPERNYNKKKKRKYKRRYSEDVYLDTELYTGEPFVATPNGYMVPIDASQICHVHGYQYLPNMYPSVLPDEGFVSVEHSPYFPEYVPEATYHKRNHYDPTEHRYSRARFHHLHDGERRQVEEVLQETATTTLPADAKPPKDFNESCDSGVSESEELSHLTTQGKGDSQGEDKKKEKEVKEVKKESSPASSSFKETKNAEDKSTSPEKEEKLKAKKEARKRTKNQKREKPKKEVIEILEPDFSSFSGSTLKFESKESKQSKELSEKQKQTKKTKKPKKKNEQAKIEVSEESSVSVVPETATSNATPTATPTPTPTTSAKSVPDTVITNVANHIEKDSSPPVPSPTKERKSKLKKSSDVVKDDQTESKTTENIESAPAKKSRRKKSKAQKKELDKLNDEGSNVKKINVASAIKDCLANEDFAEQIFEDDRLSQESENVAISEECWSQESETTVTSEECLSQESENTATSDIWLTEEKEIVSKCQENETTKVRESLSETSDVAITEECFTQESCPQSSASLTASSPVLNAEEPLNSSELEALPESLVQNISSSKVVPDEDVVHSHSVMSNTAAEDDVCPISRDEKSNSVTPRLETPSGDDTLSLPPEEEEDEELPQSFKDLGVTEAVRRWIREVTPEKAFKISDQTRSLIFPSVISSSDEDSEPEAPEASQKDDHATLSHFSSSTERQPKNVKGNPSAASPSDSSLDARSERVAQSTFSPAAAASRRDATPPAAARTGLRSPTSQDVFDDYDGASEISNLSRGRLYSTSSLSSLPSTSQLEDPCTPTLEDPRVYDPTIYSKYYQLGADVRGTPSNTSTRESTLSPSPEDSGSGVDLFPGDSSPPSADSHCMPLATELFKSEKIRHNMTHISPSLSESALPLPYWCPSSSLGELENKTDTNTSPTSTVSKHGHLCSVSSSGIGSSLASTPNGSPAHQPLPPPSLPTVTANHKPKLEPHPLKNLSVGEGPLPCKAVCCSVM